MIRSLFRDLPDSTPLFAGMLRMPKIGPAGVDLRGDGTSQETGVPTPDASENIAWKNLELPGRGHASPIVWLDRIFLVSCLEDRHDRVLLCLDGIQRPHPLATDRHQRPAGAQAPPQQLRFEHPGHRRQPGLRELPRRREDARGGLRLRGRQQWLVRPGEFHSRHGYCSSRVVREILLVNGDHDGDSYLVALDRARADGVEIHAGKQDPQLLRADRPRDRRPHADGALRQQVRGQLRPAHGSRHWIIDGPTEQFVASMVYNGKLLFLTAGFPQHHILAIRPDGHGNVTDTHVVWRTTKGCSYVPRRSSRPMGVISWSWPTRASPVARGRLPAAAIGCSGSAAL